MELNKLEEAVKWLIDKKELEKQIAILERTAQPVKTIMIEHEKFEGQVNYEDDDEFNGLVKTMLISRLKERVYKINQAIEAL